MRRIGIIFALALCIWPAVASAKVDVVEQFVNACETADIPVLEKVLAPNFWYIGANGHIRDKEHFIGELKDRELVIKAIRFTNTREEALGSTRLLTANGAFSGHFTAPLPTGLMRYTMVLGNNRGEEQLVLFQATPVVATPECEDGNCKIR